MRTSRVQKICFNNRSHSNNYSQSKSNAQEKKNKADKVIAPFHQFACRARFARGAHRRLNHAARRRPYNTRRRRLPSCRCSHHRPRRPHSNNPTTASSRPYHHRITRHSFWNLAQNSTAPFSKVRNHIRRRQRRRVIVEPIISKQLSSIASRVCRLTTGPFVPRANWHL